jgi:uncharacterized protein YbaP (TraB family)
MALESGLLWQLKFNESKTSYLFGTIHLNSSLFLEHQQMFSSLLDQCSVFAAEVNLDQMGQHEMNNYFKLPENSDWSGKLKPNQWNKMKRICDLRFQLNLDYFMNVYPLVLVNQLSLQLIGMNVEKSLDQSLWELATSKNIQCVGLEDFDQHFSMISLIHINDQLKMLKDLLKNIDQSRRKYLKMLKDYHAEDLRTIYQSSKKMLGKYRRMMLYERNVIMFDKILTIAQADSSFITCGAGHLYGEYGILRLLKKHGVQLKHVSW